MNNSQKLEIVYTEEDSNDDLMRFDISQEKTQDLEQLREKYPLLYNSKIISVSSLRVQDADQTLKKEQKVDNDEEEKKTVQNQRTSSLFESYARTDMKQE